MPKLKELFAKFLRLKKVIKGHDLFIKQDISIHVDSYGNPGTSWTICSDILNEKSIVYSFGVGDDISFDLGLINRFDLEINAFDPTPKSIDWINNQKLPRQFVLHPVGLANFDGKAKFHPPVNPDHISATMLERNETRDQAYKVEVKTLKTIMQELGHSQIDVLKMDIEGMEYDVIDDFLAQNIMPSQILIEFHHRFNGVGIKKTEAAVQNLRKMGYLVFSISQTGEEISFIRKDKVPV
ncbi:MAG: FkbM family methyltransferase [Bacteroidales bacterium]